MTDRYSRQSFLGVDAERRLAEATIAVVGLGGGGSHIVQQAAHLGFKRFVLIDHDVVEESNLNRLVSATIADARGRAPKVVVAERLVRGLQDDAVVTALQSRWQDAMDPLVTSDIVFGCVDSFGERDQLERACRRHLIPLIDIGLDVTVAGSEPPFLAGQVIVSMPGGPCMWCLGFLNEAVMSAEARKYGDAGARPQVVFGNGVLASLAVAQAVAMLTDWLGPRPAPVYLEYRGNEMTVRPSARLKFVPPTCEHFPVSTAGAPRFRAV